MSVVLSGTTSENKRAQSGESMAGGAADWNKGGPVAVGSKKSVGVFGNWICQRSRRTFVSFATPLPFPRKYKIWGM